MTDSLVYVYAVGDRELAERDDLPEIVGFHGRPVSAIPCDPLTAVVSSVPENEFGEDALRRNLEDLDWLSITARTHNAVVDALAAMSPIAPLRLFTVYVAEGNVRALLSERAEELTAALARIRGRVEWGVKAFLADPEEADEPPPEDSGGAGPGTSYLMRKRARREEAAKGQAAGTDAAERLHQRLADVAVASRRYPPQDPRLSGYPEPMVLNAAYLVDRADTDLLRHELAEPGFSRLRLELTGPWAPYSFATLEEP